MYAYLKCSKCKIRLFFASFSFFCIRIVLNQVLLLGSLIPSGHAWKLSSQAAFSLTCRLRNPSSIANVTKVQDNTVLPMPNLALPKHREWKLKHSSQIHCRRDTLLCSSIPSDHAWERSWQAAFSPPFPLQLSSCGLGWWSRWTTPKSTPKTPPKLMISQVKLRLWCVLPSSALVLFLVPSPKSDPKMNFSLNLYICINNHWWCGSCNIL